MSFVAVPSLGLASIALGIALHLFDQQVWFVFPEIAIFVFGWLALWAWRIQRTPCRDGESGSPNRTTQFFSLGLLIGYGLAVLLLAALMAIEH